jgi:hypothetical protein
LRDSRSGFSLDISLDIRSDISLDISTWQRARENVQSRAPVATLPHVDKANVTRTAVAMVRALVGAESLQFLQVTAQLAIANLQSLGELFLPGENARVLARIPTDSIQTLRRAAAEPCLAHDARLEEMVSNCASW